MLSDLNACSKRWNSFEPVSHYKQRLNQNTTTTIFTTTTTSTACQSALTDINTKTCAPSASRSADSSPLFVQRNANICPTVAQSYLVNNAGDSSSSFSIYKLARHSQIATLSNKLKQDKNEIISSNTNLNRPNVNGFSTTASANTTTPDTTIVSRPTRLGSKTKNILESKILQRNAISAAAACLSTNSSGATICSPSSCQYTTGKSYMPTSSVSTPIRLNTVKTIATISNGSSAGLRRSSAFSTNSFLLESIKSNIAGVGSIGNGSNGCDGNILSSIKVDGNRNNGNNQSKTFNVSYPRLDDNNNSKVKIANGQNKSSSTDQHTKLPTIDDKNSQRLQTDLTHDTLGRGTLASQVYTQLRQQAEHASANMNGLYRSTLSEQINSASTRQSAWNSSAATVSDATVNDFNSSVLHQYSPTRVFEQIMPRNRPNSPFISSNRSAAMVAARRQLPLHATNSLPLRLTGNGIKNCFLSGNKLCNSSGASSLSTLNTNTTFRSDSSSEANGCQTIELKRDSRFPSGGFRLIEGSIYGQKGALFVQNVESDSPAGQAGLRSGDQLLTVGDNRVTSSDPIAVAELIRIQLMKTERPLRLCFRPREFVFRAPNTGFDYRRADVQGNTVQPPSTDTLEDASTNQVTIQLEKNTSLGLVIKGGLEYGVGIFVSGVDVGSQSHLAGLRVGDEILSANGHDFRQLMHDEAVNILRNSSTLRLCLRHGADPISPTFARKPSINNGITFQVASLSDGWSELMAPLNHRLETSFWKNPIPSDNFLERSIDPSNFSVENAPFALDPNVYTADQRLQQRIVQLLDEQEQVTFQVYRKEYFNRNMDLQTFVSLLLPLLNTPGKYQLFGEIRSFIRTEDLDRFDELLFRQEEQRLLNRGLNYQLVEQMRRLNKSMWPESTSGHRFEQQSSALALPPSHPLQSIPTDGRRWSDSLPSGQRTERTMDREKLKYASGFEMNSLPGDHDFRFGIRSSPPINGLPIRNGNLMYNSSYPTYYENSGVVSDLYPLPSNSGSENDEFGNFKYYGNSLLQDDLLHNRVRRHQSLPGESFTQDLGHYPMNEDIAHLQKGIGFRPPMRRTSFGQTGKSVVRIKKSKPILGIAIEGGINVPDQPQPRIISIHATGSAHQSGELRVGHIILEIDGVSTENLTHSEVAQLLAQFYYTDSNDYLELMVREKRKNELDMRRNSFMLLKDSYE